MGSNRTQNKRNQYFQGERIIIGVDQAYSNTGISIAIDGKLKVVTSLPFLHVKTKTAKRLLLAEKIDQAIQSCLKHGKPEEIAIVAERIRTFTATSELRPDFLKTGGALMAYIVDTAWKYGIYTYSIDTRAWKSAVVGDWRPVFEPVEGVKDPQKFGSVRLVMKLGFDNSLLKIRGKGGKGHIFRDDNAADSACIALSPFKAEANRFRKEF